MLRRLLLGLVLLLPALTASFLHAALAQEPMRIVFASELVPLSFKDQGDLRGILVDIADEIFVKRLGQKVEMLVFPWERAQQMVMRGQADAFITVATEARRRYANCGENTVLETPLHPVVQRDHAKRAVIEAARRLADLKPFDIVSYNGNGWAKQNLVGFNVYFATDFPTSMRGLAQGRGDVAFASNAAGIYFLKKEGLGDRLIILPLVVDTLKYVLCVGKKSPYVGQLAEFERVLEILKREDGERAIFTRYGLTPEMIQ
jgi:polar amino acid transport system substrate-binding protein